MATITLKDLPENTELDRQAMLAIAGGARARGPAFAPARPAPQGARLFDLTPAGAGKPPATRPPSR